jgi:hypothetical protein
VGAEAATLPLLAGVTYLAVGLAGVAAGLSAAAAGLALAGQSLFEAPPERAHLFLVLGPLCGLLPVALLAAGAARHPEVRHRAPVALGVWVIAAVAATCWFGLRPLLQ